MPRLLHSALIATAFGALLAAPAQAGVKAGSKTITTGDVTATLSWKGGPSLAQKAHVKIDRTGSPTFEADLTDACELCDELGDPTNALHVRDVDGDGEPEVFVDAFTGGAHCCSITAVYYFDGTTYQNAYNVWGNGFYKLTNLDGDGKLEFRADDDRFAYEFAAYAFSYRPPLIYDFSAGKFTDVTRRFPKVILKDIRFIDRSLPDARKNGDPRGLIAARMADLALLRQRSKISPYLAKALKRGDLKGDTIWPAGKKFKPALLKFLRKLHYIA